MTEPVKDFTGAEAHVAFSEFEKAVGPRADVYVSLNAGRYGDKQPWRISVYPDGMSGGRDQYFALSDDALVGLLVAASRKWDELRDEHYRRTISAMALEIIRLTDENGEATDAALRSAGYDGDLVRIYGKRAAERATEMAGRGPFTLKTLGGDNGAPVESEEDAR